MDNSGNFAITWQSDRQDGSGFGIYAQRFDSSGEPEDDEFRVNSFTRNRQMLPSIAMDDFENFVITWQSQGLYNYRFVIMAQKFDSGGNTVDNEFRVNENILGTQAASSVAMDSDGDFVVTWMSFNLLRWYAGWDIYAKYFPK